MVNQNAINLEVIPVNDGFSIAGGTTSRQLIIGSGNIELYGGNNYTYSFPGSTTTLVGINTSQVLSGKSFSDSISVAGSVVAGSGIFSYGGFSGNIITSGNVIAGSYTGYGGGLTGVVAGTVAQDNTYSVCGSAIAVTTNKTMMDLFNNQSGSLVIINKIVAYPRNSAAVTGIQQVLEVFRTTAVGTGGTALTFDRLDTTSPTLSNSITARSAPTATRVGAPIIGAAIYTEEGANAQSTLPIYDNNGTTYVQPITLRASEGIMLRTGPLGGAGTVSIVVHFRVRTA